MKRSSYITWDQLKVGALILVALVILAITILKLGQAGKLFGKRYHLVSFIDNASGLRVGGPVSVAGQQAGSIKDIDFLPPSYDTTRHLRVLIEVDRSLAEQVRADSRAKIKSSGLLGDKAFDISVGTPRYRTLHDGDTLIVVPSVDYEAVVSQASGAINEVVGLTHDLKKVTGGISRGEGTLGQLLTNRELYDNLNSSLARTSALMARRTSSLVRLAASGSAGRRARDTRVLTADRVERFRSRFLREARTRFFADWVFATRAVIIREMAQLQ